MKRYFFIILMLYSAGATADAVSSNQLQKIFLHRMNPSGNVPVAMEMCRLVFYFSKEPLMLPDNKKINKDGTTTQTFIFPLSEISAEVEPMIAKCNANKEADYFVHIRAINKPIKGLQLTLNYDPKSVLFEYDSFQAIGPQKALVFTFYNKKLLEKMKNADQSILQTAWGMPPKVVIDCGHGGQDSGARGFYQLVEKDLTLKVGKMLAEYAQDHGWEVILTRANDVLIPLDERTAIANTSKADLLISLHANYSTNENALGIETFFFDKSLLKPLCQSSVCNHEVAKKMSDNLYKLSNLLALMVHNEVLSATAPVSIDRKVKKAAPQILLGSIVPSILIELGFVSNKQEAAYLNNPDYQKRLVRGIYAGMVNYIHERRV